MSDAAVRAEPTDHQLAHDLATQAGQLLVALRASLAGATEQERKSAGDATSHEYLMAQLRELRPDDCVLSEEARHDELEAFRTSRATARRVWVIDPLDGTREFGETDRTDWAVHVALVIDGIAEVGAVALPALQQTFSTLKPLTLVRAQTPPRVIVSRSRPPAEALAIAESLGAELVEMGSAGAKAMAVGQGLAEVYPHSGGQYEWDSAAPVAVAQHAGLWCSRIDGSELRYNNIDPYLPDLLICRPELAQAALLAARTKA